MRISTSLCALAFAAAGAWMPSAVLAQGGREGGPPPGGERGPSPDAFVDRMMENDANGDGKLARDEVTGRFADQMFETGDADKDGFLTREELAAYFESRPRFGQPQPAGGPGGPAGTVDTHMRQAGQAMRALRRSPFSAESREDDLTRIGVIQASLVGAKSVIDPEHMAPQAKAKFGEDKAAYVNAMRREVIRAIRAALELEELIITGDSAGSRAALEKLIAVQREGHEQFQEPEEEEERPGRGQPAGGERPGRGGGRPGSGGGAGGGN